MKTNSDYRLAASVIPIGWRRLAFPKLEGIDMGGKTEMKPNNKNNPGNGYNTVSIRGERVLIDSDESWIKNVEEQGAKGAGSAETYVIIDKISKSARKAEMAAMKAEQAARQATLHRSNKANKGGIEAGSNKL